MVQGIVNGASGAVKGAGAVVRGAQSGFVRAYALLLVGGFAALGDLLPGGGELMASLVTRRSSLDGAQC